MDLSVNCFFKDMLNINCSASPESKSVVLFFMTSI